MVDSLIQELEALKYREAKPGTHLESGNGLVDACIAIVRQHQAEQLPDMVERIAAAIFDSSDVEYLVETAFEDDPDEVQFKPVKWEYANEYDRWRCMKNAKAIMAILEDDGAIRSSEAGETDRRTESLVNVDDTNVGKRENAAKHNPSEMRLVEARKAIFQAGPDTVSEEHLDSIMEAIRPYLRTTEPSPPATEVLFAYVNERAFDHKTMLIVEDLIAKMLPYLRTTEPVMVDLEVAAKDIATVSCRGSRWQAYVPHAKACTKAWGLKWK